MIILSPTGPYYAAPMRIYVEEKYVRAVPGGVGFAKNAGNYGAAMLATAEAKKKGYDQVLWTDAFEHKYVQEIGTMNVFFIIGNTAITPILEEGYYPGWCYPSKCHYIIERNGFYSRRKAIEY